jgi:hypothetical protein
MRMGLLAVVSFLATANCAKAADVQSHAFLAYGAAGASSCGDWTSTRRAQQDPRGLIDWSLGFVSATGKYEVLQPTTPEGVIAAIDNYCSSHPLASLTHGVTAVVIQMGGAVGTFND